MIHFYYKYRYKRKLLNIENQYILTIHQYGQNLENAHFFQIGETSISFQKEIKKLLTSIKELNQFYETIFLVYNTEKLEISMKNFISMADQFKKASLKNQKYINKVEKYQNEAKRLLEEYRKEKKEK